MLDVLVRHVRLFDSIDSHTVVITQPPLSTLSELEESNSTGKLLPTEPSVLPVSVSEQPPLDDKEAGNLTTSGSNNSNSKTVIASS